MFLVKAWGCPLWSLILAPAHNSASARTNTIMPGEPVFTAFPPHGHARWLVRAEAKLYMCIYIKGEEARGVGLDAFAHLSSP